MKAYGTSLKPEIFILILLLGCSSASTLFLPPHIQDFLQYLQLEKQRLDPAAGGVAQQKRYPSFDYPSLKRSYSPDKVTTDEVRKGIEKYYMQIPKEIIATSEILHHGVNCSEYRVANKLFENHLPFLPNTNRMRPLWLLRSKLISTCPTQYVEREMKSEIEHGAVRPVPLTIIEAKCVCEGSQCAADGSVCVPLSYELPYYVNLRLDEYSQSSKLVTVACVCAKKPGYEVKSITLDDKK